MGTYAAVGHVTYVNGYDLSGDLTKNELAFSWEALEDTRFTPGTTMPARTRTGGLQDVEAGCEGFAQYGTGLVDDVLFTGLGSTAQVVTQAPDSTEGSVAYFYEARKFGYQTFGEIGQLVPFAASMQGAHGYGGVRGRLLKAKGDVSATGATGTGVQIGAVDSDEFVYAAFHVFGTPGTTITAVLESDNANNFPSATTRITFGPITTAGGTFAARVAGAITDDWWRVRITAITGTFSIACAAGIQTAQ